MSLTAALVEPAWSSLTAPTLPRLRLVSLFLSGISVHYTNSAIAKFTGYQYGGRPLGITFVKYANASQEHGEHGDIMDGAEPTGITQDQIM